MTTDDLSLKMGPQPPLAVAALRALGMSRDEVARYFRITPKVLRELEGAADDNGRVRIGSKRPVFDFAQRRRAL